MAMVHDRALLDALEAAGAVALDRDVWRVTRAEREPLQGSAAPGRWTPGDGSEVLYTSFERDGALAEIGFRLGLEPIWPSRIRHRLHRIAARTERTLQIADVSKLAAFGIDTDRYSGFDYRACQALAAAAHFMGFDSLAVPSARYPARNLVIFLAGAPAAGLVVRSSEDVDWRAWRRANRR